MTELDITRSIDIKATTTKVWAALTESDLIAQWFGDKIEFEAKPGSTGSFGWSEHGDMTFRLLVEEVDEPHTLSYRWARESNADPTPTNSTLVRFDLAEIDGGTRLTMVETGFEALDDPQAHRAGNDGGWTHELGKLVAFAESA